MWSCLTKYDEDAERKFLKNEGRAEGRRLEAERMGTLISRLIKEKRISDADRASTDAGYRESLYKEFNL